MKLVHTSLSQVIIKILLLHLRDVQNKMLQQPLYLQQLDLHIFPFRSKMKGVVCFLATPHDCLHIWFTNAHTVVNTTVYLQMGKTAFIRERQIFFWGGVL